MELIIGITIGLIAAAIFSAGYSNGWKDGYIDSANDRVCFPEKHEKTLKKLEGRD